MTNAATIEKRVMRRSHTKKVDGVTYRWRTSRTVYDVRYPSGRVMPCDSRSEAERYAADESLAIAALNPESMS